MLQCVKIDESYQLYFKGEISIETIIQQIIVDLKEEIIKKACSEKITNLDSLAADIFEDCAKASCLILQEIIKVLNQKIKNDKSSRKNS